jgi:hypothetical protein
MKGQTVPLNSWGRTIINRIEATRTPGSFGGTDIKGENGELIACDHGDKVYVDNPEAFQSLVQEATFRDP